MKFATRKKFIVTGQTKSGNEVVTFVVEAYTRDEAHMEAATRLNVEFPLYTLTNLEEIK